jgi:glyoxylase-like metal-dependent hydrolase (beta-lactamase superfamily II)
MRHYDLVVRAQSHFARIRDKVRMVRGGGDGLVISGGALTNAIVSFQHPSWRVPLDHEADLAIASRLRLLDQLAADKRRLVGAHLPFPGTGFVERKDGAYRFVPA